MCNVTGTTFIAQSEGRALPQGEEGFHKGMAEPKVLICIVAWNKKDLTSRCVESVLQMQYGNKVVAVIDNASTDGTDEHIRRCFPAVRVIRTPENIGFAGAGNVAIQSAVECAAEYLFLINNDLTFAPTTLRQLVEAAEADTRAAICAPLVLSAEAPEIVTSAGRDLDPDDFRFLHRMGDLSQFQSREPYSVPAVSGCAMFLRIRLISTHGGFHAGYFLYCEDTEICLRATRAGHKVLVVPSAHVWHAAHASFPAFWANYFDTRNWLAFIRRNSLPSERRQLVYRNAFRELWSQRLLPYILGSESGLRARIGSAISTLALRRNRWSIEALAVIAGVADFLLGLEYRGGAGKVVLRFVELMASRNGRARS